MTKPDRVLQDLADESLTDDLSKEEWLDYLRELEFEVKHWIDMVKHEIENS